MTLAQLADPHGLADEHLSVSTDKGANAGLKVTSLVADMVAGADSIDDMAMLRHSDMGKLSTRIYAPPRWGRSCGSSPSGMSVNSTQSHPASWPGWQG